MKKLLLFMSIVILVISETQCQEHGNTIIGRLESGEPIITLRESIIKSKWENVLSDEDIDVDFTEFGIITYDESSYMLIGIDETNGLEAAVGLVIVGNQFYEVLESGNSHTITCKGCSWACHPKKEGENWICHPDCDPCEKTEVIVTGNAIFN
jgi:hypothetical protein